MHTVWWIVSYNNKEIIIGSEMLELPRAQKQTYGKLIVHHIL